jgi:hypothetical protein
MHCIILLPDAAGRVPTAQELRQRGFVVSAAVGLPGPAPAVENVQAEQGRSSLPWGQAPALAAEKPAPYGEPRPPER